MHRCSVSDSTRHPRDIGQAEVAQLETRFKELSRATAVALAAGMMVTNSTKVGSNLANEANRMSMAGVVCALSGYRTENSEYPRRSRPSCRSSPRYCR